MELQKIEEDIEKENEKAAKELDESLEDLEYVKDVVGAYNE